MITILHNNNETSSVVKYIGPYFNAVHWDNAIVLLRSFPSLKQNLGIGQNLG